MYMTDYRELKLQAEALVAEVPHFIANLANLSALLYQTMEEINWAGFYLTEQDLLVLGPFQGKTACIEIPYGKGVCGTAALQDAPLLVEDVHQFAGHIACDSASRSEIVIPFHRNGKVAGVLDIDSPVLSRFSQEDLEGLSAIVKILEETF